MHITLDNLLHDFSNDKYMLFSLYKKGNIPEAACTDLSAIQ